MQVWAPLRAARWAARILVIMPPLLIALPEPPAMASYWRSSARPSTREGQDVARWNLLHPLETPRVSFVAQQLGGRPGPVVASTDYMKNYAEQIRAFVPAGRSYTVLGTDGFGRSDFRYRLREHFEVNRHYITVAALSALADEGKLPKAKVAEAIAKYGIQTEKINPLHA